MQDFVTTIRFFACQMARPTHGNRGGKKAGHAEDVDPAYHTQLGIRCYGVVTFQIRSSLFKGGLRLLAGSLDVRAESAWVHLAHWKGFSQE